MATQYSGLEEDVMRDMDYERRVYYCKRKTCGRKIKIMAFQGTDQYCSVDCEKYDADPNYVPRGKNFKFPTTA